MWLKRPSARSTRRLALLPDKQNEPAQGIPWAGFYILQKQIEYQCQQRRILIFLAISGHQQNQQDDQQVTGIEITGKQILQEGSHTAASGRLRPVWARFRPVGSSVWFWAGCRLWGLLMGTISRTDGCWLGWRLTLGYWRRPAWLLRRLRIRKPASSVTAIRLRDIAVIHDFTSLSEVRYHFAPEIRRPALPFLPPA